MVAQLNDVWWMLGWLVAVGMLINVAFRAACGSQRADRLRDFKRVFFVLIAVTVATLAQLAASNHDVHFDATRHKVLTADNATLELIDSLSEPVKIIYFGHEDDHQARRLMSILGTLARRSKLLQVHTTDPDKDPMLARQYGVNFYNVAVVEAAGRRVLARSTDEVDIALSIQKALRQKTVSLCFVEGHGEAEIFNEEFHTHMESVGGGGGGSDHHHGHAHIPIIQSTAHGIGRLRRSLEALGYEPRLINLTTNAMQPCNAVSIVQPRHPFSPDEIKRLEHYHADGASILIFVDLGYEMGELERFLTKYGIRIENTVLTDAEQHHETNAQSIAISSYPGHVITDKVSMVIFPGARSLKVEKTEHSLSSVVVANRSTNRLLLDAAPLAEQPEAQPPIIAVAKDTTQTSGKLLVAGDADFITNSYFPYLSNSALAIAIYRWAVGEHDAIDTQPVIPVFERIVLTQSDMDKLFFGLVIALPGLVMLLGGLVWFRQR
ncbi:MAG: Gldg family protein [Gammaproteobacteria bacterium]